MAKSFKVQINPTFKMPVDVPRVGGDPMRVSFVFRSMDRRELSRMFDGWKKEGDELVAQMRADAEAGEPWSLEKLTDAEIEMQARQVKQIAVGWGFDDEFTDENIEALVSTSVSVCDAIVAQYHEGYQRAKSGN